MISECFNEVWLPIVLITNRKNKEYFMNDIGGIYYFESGKLQFLFVDTHLLGKRYSTKPQYFCYKNHSFFAKQACFDSKKVKFYCFFNSFFPRKSD